MNKIYLPTKNDFMQNRCNKNKTISKKRRPRILGLLTIAVIFSTLLGLHAIFQSMNYQNDSLSPNDTFIQTINGIDYIAKYITEEDVDEMKTQLSLYEDSMLLEDISNKEYKTGARIPTEEELEQLIGLTSIIDVTSGPNMLRTAGYKDLSKEPYFPVVGNQGGQGSCTAWANVYYSYGYLEAKDNGWAASTGNPEYLLSPSWAYNKLVNLYEPKSDSDFELLLSAISQATMTYQYVNIMKDIGCATLKTMPYDDTDYDSWGEEAAWREAPYHKPRDFIYLHFGGPFGFYSLWIIKWIVDAGYPVTFGLDSKYLYYGLDKSSGDYILSSDEYVTELIYDHAQTIVGYDDSITEGSDVGAFRVVNSWGPDWMDNGYYWITYEAYKEAAQHWFNFIGFFIDRIDYQPSLIATWEFDPAPTQMNNIFSVGIGTQDNTIGKITPRYRKDDSDIFPSFMALDVSDFKSDLDSNPNLNFYLDIGSAATPGIISSFRVEKYELGVLADITPESLDVPRATPGFVNVQFI